jgi:UDP-N-acetylmuramoyl-tripeptide--D-alanyl-D-alanine ligase
MLSNLFLSDVIAWTHAQAAKGAQAPLVLPKEPITGISTDTRSLHKGCVFAAIKGERFDGHNYLHEAANKGAIAALVEVPPVGTPPLPVLVVKSTVHALAAIASQLRNRFTGPVFALTGSAGKSSTKNMLASLLGDAVLASPKSFNNLLGVSQTLFLLEEATDKIVLEMGMNARGEIAEMCQYFRPQMGLITNIGTAHIGRLGGQEQIFFAKKELFDAVAAGASSRSAIAVNVDDPLVVRAAKEAVPKSIHRLTYSASGANADVQIQSKSLHPQTGALNVAMHFGGKSGTYDLPVFGLHQAENLAAAVAGALLMGESTAQIESRLSQIRSSEHRGEMFRSPQGVFVLDESYNSNPSALIASLGSAFELNPSLRRVLVLGEMKELDAFSDELHEKAAQALLSIYRAKRIPFVLIGVGSGFAPFTAYIQKHAPEVVTHAARDASEAAALVKQVLKPEDIVLIKGSRGIALDQVVKTLK